MTRENANIMQRYLMEQAGSGGTKMALDFEEKGAGNGEKVQSSSKNMKGDLATQNLRVALNKHKNLIGFESQDSSAKQHTMISAAASSSSSKQSKSNYSLLNETQRTSQIEQQLQLQQSSTAAKQGNSLAAGGKTATILVSKSKTKTGLPLLLKTPAN